jgi:uncharacterized protein (DUF1697 family)
MTTLVALLRGVNVGKAKRVPMADLRRVLGSLGYEDAATLLNSGNVVFRAGNGAWPHAVRIRSALLAATGVDAQVVVKTDAEFAAICAENPLEPIARNASRLLVAFTQEPPAETFNTWAASDWAPDRLILTRYAAYLWCAQGVLDSRLFQAVNRGLGDRVTTRNWATVKKIGQLLKTLDA